MSKKSVMVDDRIPDDVKQFILEHIDSIAQLEALLLLRGSPEVDWTANAVAERLYIGEQNASVILQRLCAGGFLIANLEKSLLYRYHVGSPNLGQTVDRVAGLYSRYLIPVTNLIHGKSRTRVQEFADAFKLKPDKD
ncbi:MAG: MarR family transcriptional regulator [Gammaproteobacteria bacterium]